MAKQISATILSLADKDILTALVADMNALRAANVILLAKLDLDAGVTDTTYTSLCTPAAATVVA